MRNSRSLNCRMWDKIRVDSIRPDWSESPGPMFYSGLKLIEIQYAVGRWALIVDFLPHWGLAVIARNGSSLINSQINLQKIVSKVSKHAITLNNVE